MAGRGQQEQRLLLDFNRELCQWELVGHYGLLVSDLWEDTGFHCGECLKVMVDSKWVATRMEMPAEQKWYLVDTHYYGNLEYVQAGIRKKRNRLLESK